MKRHVAMMAILSGLLAGCTVSRPEVARISGAKHSLAKGSGAEAWPGGGTRNGDLPQGIVWRASGSSRGTILCLHGVQTHAAWFAPVARELNRRGWTVIAPDRRGSGVNADRPYRHGHSGSRTELLRDLEGQMGLAAQEAGAGKPLILLGTSWGSNVAGTYLMKELESSTPADGLVLLVPAIKSVQPPLPEKLAILFSSVLFPTKQWKLPFQDSDYLGASPPSLSPGDAELLQWLRGDEALVRRPSVKTLVVGNGLGKWKSKAEALRKSGFPILLLTSDQDRIMDSAAALECLGGPAREEEGERFRHETFSAGHGVQLTHPAAIAASVDGWGRGNFQ